MRSIALQTVSVWSVILFIHSRLNAKDSSPSLGVGRDIIPVLTQSNDWTILDGVAQMACTTGEIWFVWLAAARRYQNR